jgi:hypothetical protein
MSAAVTSASVKLPNGVLVSIGDSPGSIKNMVQELTILLGEDAARAFMSKVRAAFLSDTEMYVPPARPSSGGNRNWAGNNQRQQPQQQTSTPPWEQVTTEPYQGRQLTATPAAGNGHYCNHGEMVHKAGISTKGNAYELWECPAKQCETQWPPRN